MAVSRRAVVAAIAGGLLALVGVLLLTPPATPEPAQGTAPPAGTTPGVGGEATRIRSEGRTVSQQERAEAIARAQVWRAPATPIGRVRFGADAPVQPLFECRFRMSDLGGTTPKFNCLLPSGSELRVKYGPGAEVPAEAAASRLLSALGFGADTVMPVARLRCHGCPEEPFVTSKLVEVTRTQPLYERLAGEDGYEDFEWVAVEQKFAARPIESETSRGWAFFELDLVDPSKGGAPRAHVDALRLLAVFLAHWDNKAENQRLVCLSQTWPEGTPCPEPFLLLQDVGSTFGPKRVNLEDWERSRLWDDRQACTISMEELPYGGGTFGSTRVSEAGRRFLASQLDQLTDAQLTDLFTWARFDKPRSAWMPASPVSEWVRVFRTRARAIGEGPPCPAA